MSTAPVEARQDVSHGESGVPSCGSLNPQGRHDAFGVEVKIVECRIHDVCSSTSRAGLFHVRMDAFQRSHRFVQDARAPEGPVEVGPRKTQQSVRLGNGYQDAGVEYRAEARPYRFSASRSRRASARAIR